MSGPIYLFKIELADIKPKIWREFFVPAEISLADLHEVIQRVMGWNNAHLHEFEINKALYQKKPESDLPAKKTSMHRLIDLVPTQTKTIHYIYDFGDFWDHTLKLVNPDFSPMEGFSSSYGCLRGARACPPEDIGGPYGYPDFLEAINNPDHPEHSEMKKWYRNAFDTEGDFDSERFDLKNINKLLAKIKPQKPRQKLGSKVA